MAGLHLGVELVWLLLAWVAGALVTLAAGVPLAQGRRVPAIGALAGPVLALGAAPALAALALADSADARQGVDTAGVTRILAMLAAPAIVGWAGLFLGLAGFRARPRAPGAAGMVAVAALVAAGLVLAGGVQADDTVFASFRAVMAVVVGAVAAVAALGARQDGPGASSAAAGAVAGALGFATVEAGMRGIASAVMAGQIAAMEPQFKLKAAEAFLAVAAAQAPWQVAGLAVWTVAAIGVTVMAAQTTRSAATVLLALPIAWAILLLGHPGVELLARL